MNKGTDVLNRAEAAFLIQQNHTSIWREAAAFCLARKVWTKDEKGERTPFTPDPKLQNTTALRALNDMASGMQSAFISAGESWWTWEPADELPVKTDALYDWYLNATEIALRQLGPSGFYSRAGELLKDAGGIGTSIMMIEGPKYGTDTPLNCSTYDIGSYAIRENCAGFVDGVWWRMVRTVDQANQEWPDFNLPKWEKLTADKKMTMEENFTLEIIPREQIEVDASAGQRGMPISATVVHDESKAVVWEGGFEEMPAIAYRFERQSGTNPWGVGPGINALADSRGVNWLDAQIADGVGKMVEPSILAKDDMRGTLDLRMGGVSMVPDLSQAPRPLFEVGNMQTGEAFLEKKQRQLRGHFFADLFAFFMDDRSYKTATEVMEIKAEKLDLFGPFGHRFLVEFVDRALERIFMVLFRQGIFGQPPREAFIRTPKGWKFLYPKSVQQSRMSLLLHQQGNREIRQLLADIMPIAQIDPSALDHLDMNVIVRHLARGSVAMRKITRTPEEAAMIGQARAQAAAQQQQMDMIAKFATKNPDHAAALAQGGMAQTA